jgi:general secretion pathway protein G
MMRNKRSRKAFSLIEIMIVVIIMGLLASVVVPNLIGKSDDAKVKLTKVQIKQIGESLKLFRLDVGRYPTTAEGLKALVTKPGDDVEFANYTTGGYLGGKSVPLDPWNNPYVYVVDGDSPVIISFGGDGKEGGEDVNADIRIPID